MNKNKIVFSGVQPTGNLHLGKLSWGIKKFCFTSKRNELYLLCGRFTCDHSISKT